MPDLLSIRGRRFVFYKEVEFDFSQPGLSVIRGLNKDANAGSTNASGKTSLFDIIKEIILDESTSSKKKYKKGREPYAGITVQNGEHVYDILKYLGKKRFIITRDHKDKRARGLEYGNSLVKKITGIEDEEELYSLYFLDSNPHKLQSAKSVDRYRFFTNLFKLRDADNIRKLLNARLRTSLDAKAAFAEVKTNFIELKKGAVSVEEGERLAEKLTLQKSTQEKVTSQLARARKARDLVQFSVTNEKQITRFLNLSSVDTIEDDIRTLKSERAAHVDKREAVDAWRVYDKQMVQYRKHLEPVLAEIKGSKLSREEAAEGAAKYRKLSANVEQLREVADADLDELPEQLLSVEKLSLKVSRLKEELNHLEGIEDGVCSTCGQPYKSERTKKEVILLLAGAQARLQEAKKQQELERNHQERKRACSRIGELELELEILKLANRIHKLWEKIPDRPVKPEQERPEQEDIEVKIDRLSRRIEFLETVAPMVPMIQQSQELPEKDKQLAESVIKLEELSSTLSEEVSSLQSKFNLARDAHKRLRTMKKRAMDLRKQASDAPILQAMVKVYSNKYLIRMMVERYAKAVERQVNKFRKLLFSEDFTFKFEVGTKFNIWVSRRYGKKVVVSDVRKLSGAESTFFGLLLLVSLLSLVPKKRRMNFLILDEPTARMGDEAREAFARFLPILNKVIPHIVIITPREDENYEGAKVFRAVKSKGVSRLEKIN